MASVHIAGVLGRYRSQLVHTLPHHLHVVRAAATPFVRELQSTKVAATKVKIPVASGKWGDLAKCSRAVRAGNIVFIAGTCCPGDSAAEQVRAIFDVITPALEQCGASLDDVVSTRMIAADIRADWEALGEAHGDIFGETRPACTLVGGDLLMDWMKVEIEVTAVVDDT